MYHKQRTFQIYRGGGDREGVYNPIQFKINISLWIIGKQQPLYIILTYMHYYYFPPFILPGILRHYVPALTKLYQIVYVIRWELFF